MTKLYTVVLLDNLNNILASQSISPGSHYKGRSYGYPFFEMGKGENGSNLVFYENVGDACEQANRHKSDGVPAFVLGIRRECLNGCVQLDNSWRVVHPVIFPPFPSRNDIKIIFLSPDDEQEAINASSRSLETKFVDYFKEKKLFDVCESGSDIAGQSTFNIADEDIGAVDEDENASPSPLDEEATAAEAPAENSVCAIEDEVPQEDADFFARIDKARGASFCYSMGSKLSAPLDARKELKSYIEKLGSMINDVTQINEYDELSERKSSLEASLFNLALMFYPKVKDENRKHFILDDAIRNVRRLVEIEYPPEDLDSLKRSQSSLVEYEEDLICRPWKLIDLKKRNARAYARFDISEEPSGERRVSIELPAEKSEIVNRVLTKLINSDTCQSALRTVDQGEDGRYLFLVECGNTIKDIIIELDGNEGWTESPERAFINALQDYLKKNTAFEFKAPPEMKPSVIEMLYAIKTICDVAGSDKSLDNYYQTLLKRGSVDFAISFAMWGAVFGFSAIPKTKSDGIDKNAQKNIRKNLKPIIERLGMELARQSVSDEVRA